MNWQASAREVVFVSYAQGHQAPGSNSRGRRRPTRGAQAGATWTRGRRHATAAGFWSETTVPFGPSTKLGGVIAAAASPRPSTTLGASLSYSRPSADRVHTPRWVGRLDAEEQATVPTPYGPLLATGAVNLVFVGPRNGFNEPVLMVEASLDLELGPLTLGLEGTNLLSRQLRDGDFIEGSDFDAGNSTSGISVRQVGPLEALNVQATMTLAY